MRISDEKRTLKAQSIYCGKLLLLYILYLGIGAAVFKKIEFPVEIAKCKHAVGEARNGQVWKVRQTLVNLGLNTLICSGLKKFLFDYKSMPDDTLPEKLVTMFSDWTDEDCSKSSYKTIVMDTMMEEMNSEKPDRAVVNQYHRVWQQATQLGASKLGQDDELVVSQKALLDTFGEISRTSINDFSSLQSDCYGGNSRWDYHNAFFFAGTLVSTIAYLLSVISEIINDCLRKCRSKLERFVQSAKGCCKNERISSIVSFSYISIGFVLTFVLPCVAFIKIEQWTILDAVYFSIITLTTVGFGDYIPSVAPPEKYANNVRNDSVCFQAMIEPVTMVKISNRTGLPELCAPSMWPSKIEMLYTSYRIVVFTWIIFGLVWVSGLISLVTERIRKRAQIKLGSTIPTMTNSASNIISLMTPSRPSRLPVRRRLNFGQDNDENNRPVSTRESTDDFLKRQISEAMESEERRFAEIYNFNTTTGRPIRSSESEQNYDWTITRSAPRYYRAIALRNRRAEALNAVGSKKAATLPDFASPAKRSPTKRTRAQLDFSNSAPVSATEAKKAKMTKLTIRPKNQQESVSK
ncbi:Oidioi.mRNA.OKI2018_I69.chr1.g416.t1.cds [Oikopleura dioica]|uniref:Oidioi.mRNA.OKI2018_I69.chr1.g416.t1.cds n=1 Tax=Oikopleura dioica TaxID=34765 RepID=A0ABN7SPZ7_OIKDI|nr:Oidioi.mRNA.OKI2018_I69.chr1.g416.t1.cds [Oikopleura dioica]